MPYKEPQIVNEQVTNEAKKLMSDRFSMMVKYFLEDAEIYIKEINRGIRERNIKVVLSPAHTMKSSAQQLGAERVALLSGDLEDKCRSLEDGEKVDFKELAKITSDLIRELEQVAPVLLKYCE